MQPIETVLQERKELNETNDCAVVSLSQVIGKDYREVCEEMYKLGRKKRKYTPWYVIAEMQKKYNLVYVDSHKIYNNQRPRVKWFLGDAKNIPETIMIYVSGHMLVAKQGEPIWGLWNEKALVKGYYRKRKETDSKTIDFAY